MAVNVSVFDLDNFPNNPKTVTVDLTELIPFGNSGEDTWVFSAITTATASGGAAIQRLYLSKTKWGWAKSSGLKSGPYDVTASQKHLRVAIDEDSSNYVEIALDENALPLGGDVVAQNMQDKIQDAASSGGAKAGNLSYLNAAVRFTNGTFEIISGTASEFYQGVDRSSVWIGDGTTTTGLAEELGLDILFTSEDFASTQIKQTSLASDYTAAAGQMTVVNGALITGGDCIAITDGTNKEFRGIESVSNDLVTLSSGLGNSYSTGALVQVMQMQDVTGEPPPLYDTIDDYIKFAISSIVNQIDFSS